jgi:2-polyprenyl-3-methyl-5-hydroxy-6-metoxy-1,4-benzoquinol methylase
MTVSAPAYTRQDVAQRIDQRAFEEYPACSLCGGDRATEVLRTKDGCRIVQCENCTLWFTSPRLDESLWERYLRDPENPRNVKFTESRLANGVALAANVTGDKAWRKKILRRSNRTLSEIEQALGGRRGRLHEVGCGVGHFQVDAIAYGFDASGNDLNGYACQIMRDRLGLKITTGNLREVALAPESIDAFVMDDFIEHTYHPFEDLKVCARALRPGGVVWIETFHIDCAEYEEKKGDWNMLWWNHVYHFSAKTIERMLNAAGLRVFSAHTPHDHGIMTVLAVK